MNIKPIITDKDGCNFKVDNIILEISRTAVSVLGISLPLSGYIEEDYKSIEEQFDIEKMVNDLQNKNKKINVIDIDSEVCRVDGEIIFQTGNLEKYKK